MPFPPPRPARAGLIAGMAVGVLALMLVVFGTVALGHNQRTVRGAPMAAPSVTTVPVTTTATTTTTTETTTTEDTTEDTTEAEPSQEPTGPQPVLALGDNPLFGQSAGLAKVPCRLSRWRSNPQAAAAMFQTEVKCLDDAWEPLLRAVGLPFAGPDLVVPASGTGSSPCTAASTEQFAAYYCEDNNTIYMPYQTLEVDRFGAHPGVYIGLLAHEYGHHIQYLAGVRGAYDEATDEAGGFTSGKGQELSRRLELQAQCFGGMFLNYSHAAGGDVDDNIVAEANSTSNRGDHGPGADHSHGTDEHAGGWWMTGFQKGDVQGCNTWLASSADVA